MHNLTSILANHGSGAHPGSLAYSVPNAPITVHDLLLQKSDGTFELIVWNEKASGSDHTNIEFAQALPAAKLYDPTLGTDAVREMKDARSIALELSDHPIVIEIPSTK